MRTQSNHRVPFVQPERSLTPAYGFSFVLAVLVTLASAMGLIYANDLYPTEDLRQSFLANDVVSLLVGLPTLLSALWLAWRGKLVGLLLWPGALMYILYNYLAYIFAVPMNWYYLLLLALITVSAYTLIGLLASFNMHEIGQHIGGNVPVRFPAGLLIVFGLFFFVRVFVVIANFHADPAAVPASELVILPADFLIAPAWIIGGMLLWQRKPMGYAVGLGLLFQASMLFIGLIAILILQPFLTDAQFDPVSVLTVSIMGLICFFPFTMYLRGVRDHTKTRGESTTPPKGK